MDNQDRSAEAEKKMSNNNHVNRDPNAPDVVLIDTGCPADKLSAVFIGPNQCPCNSIFTSTIGLGGFCTGDEFVEGDDLAIIDTGHVSKIDEKPLYVGNVDCLPHDALPCNDGLQQCVYGSSANANHRMGLWNPITGSFLDASCLPLATGTKTTWAEDEAHTAPRLQFCFGAPEPGSVLYTPEDTGV